jgi:hypothetical protein
MHFEDKDQGEKLNWTNIRLTVTVADHAKWHIFLTFRNRA